ncbi:hypothetical protein GGE65_006283 [Skermanella aerolata]|uniref:hypothetical protein n=1 Tax=Skermanella aerolata TaxID=393310 RepID=UPI003D21D3C7
MTEFAVAEIPGKIDNPFPSWSQAINLDCLGDKVPDADLAGTVLDLGLRLVEFLILKFESFFPPAVLAQHRTEPGQFIICDQVA